MPVRMQPICRLQSLLLSQANEFAPYRCENGRYRLDLRLAKANLAMVVGVLSTASFV